MSARASFRTEPMTDREKKEARDALLFLSP